MTPEEKTLRNEHEQDLKYIDELESMLAKSNQQLQKLKEHIKQIEQFVPPQCRIDPKELKP